MKVVIAGGRDYILGPKDWAALDALTITEVISGCARGADTCGEHYALSRGIPVRKFPADWGSYGRAAGHIRNADMADYADAVALFPGGRGTENMHSQAVKRRLTIHDFRGWRS